MKRSEATFAVLASLAIVGCSVVVPSELASARAAYEHARTSRAADLKPADLHKAKEALILAEASFINEEGSDKTLDLAYVAQRKAQLAEVLAGIELASQQQSQAGQSITSSEHAIERRTEGELTDTRAQLAEAGRQGQAQNAALGAEHQNRVDADQRTADANKRTADAEVRAKSAENALAKLAMVKDEARGMVITLSGSVLFASDQATLLPEAQTRLAQVSDALMATKERNIIVEGHTDSRGSATHNMDLSQRRAEAVRAYIVSRGYEADKMEARGIGKDRPMTSNNSAEGRANNRRVEIIVENARN
jgi:outer membrane protein OmpA-like peptidoglycan-associated protein